MKIHFLLGLAAAGHLLAADPAAPTPAAGPPPVPAQPPAPASASAAPAAPLRDPANDLAKPLRKYDTNKDGKLTGEELHLARQAFNRGGKAPEMSSDDWQGVLDYFKGEWRKRNFAKLDLNNDGKLDDAEKQRVQTIWSEITVQLTAMRAGLVLKYDTNDDGNITRGERGAFDPEFNRRRYEIEQEILAKAAAAPAAAPPAPSAVPGPPGEKPGGASGTAPAGTANPASTPAATPAPASGK